MSDTQFGSSQHRNARRRQSMLLLLLGIAVALVASVFYMQGQQEEETAVMAAQSQEAFPVASTAGIDNSQANPQPGHPAPNFAFQLEDGSTVNLSDFRGRPVLINFWATWCGPCRMEMPDLVKAYEDHKDEGFVILEINTAENQETVAAFVEEFDMTMPVVIDQSRSVQAAYKTQSLPSSFFIDKDGVVQTRWIGFLNINILEEQIEKIL